MTMEYSLNDLSIYLFRLCSPLKHFQFVVYGIHIFRGVFSSNFTANNLPAICHLNFLILSFLMAAFYEAVVSQLGLLDIFLFLRLRVRHRLLMAFPLLWFCLLMINWGSVFVFVLDVIFFILWISFPPFLDKFLYSECPFVEMKSGKRKS